MSCIYDLYMNFLEFIRSFYNKTDSNKIVALTENDESYYEAVSQDDNTISSLNCEEFNTISNVNNKGKINERQIAWFDLEKAIDSSNHYKLLKRVSGDKNNSKPNLKPTTKVILPHNDPESKLIYNKTNTKIYVKNNKVYKYYKPKRTIEQQILLINILRDNSHENICTPINYYKLDIDNEIKLVEEAEYCSFDLFYAIEHDLIRFTNIYNYFYQLVSGIYHLHSVCNLAHRDLKPENILIKGLNGNYKLKLTDFEFSCELGDKSSFQGGSLAYAAPELFHNPLNDWGKIDIWALGIILYILIFKNFPWKSVDENDSYYIEYNNSPSKSQYLCRKFGYERYDIPQEYKIFVKIMYYCLKQFPSERFDSSQLINLLDTYA